MLILAFFGRKFDAEPYGFLQDEKYKQLSTKFYAIFSYRLPQFISEEQGLKATKLYEYFKESTHEIVTLNRLGNDEETKGLFNSLCGVNLYVHQRKRDLARENNLDAVIYDNEYENTALTLNLEDYKDEIGEGKRDRDTIALDMYQEIQDCYQKTLADAKINNNTKRKYRIDFQLYPIFFCSNSNKYFFCSVLPT